MACFEQEQGGHNKGGGQKRGQEGGRGGGELSLTQESSLTQRLAQQPSPVAHLRSLH